MYLRNNFENDITIRIKIIFEIITNIHWRRTQNQKSLRIKSAHRKCELKDTQWMMSSIRISEEYIPNQIYKPLKTSFKTKHNVSIFSVYRLIIGSKFPIIYLSMYKAGISYKDRICLTRCNQDLKISEMPLKLVYIDRKCGQLQRSPDAHELRYITIRNSIG
uniref:Uncharacterized protein n=1 Tax=Onchocerca volvulus TaxID=6282 RepID=A0A8R1XNE2_ONCVO